MKVYILLNLFDQTDFSGEEEILMISPDYEKVTTRMMDLWQQRVDSNPGCLDNLDTWYGEREAYVAISRGNDYDYDSYRIEERNLE